MLCHYWYIKDIGYKFEPDVCNGFHDILMMAYELKYIECKDVHYRCILWGVTKNDAVFILNSSKLDDKGILWV